MRAFGAVFFGFASVVMALVVIATIAIVQAVLR